MRGAKAWKSETVEIQRTTSWRGEKEECVARCLESRERRWSCWWLSGKVKGEGGVRV